MIRLLPLLLLAAPTVAAAGGFQDTASLDRAVAAFTGHAIGDEGGARTAVDARLKLAQCPTVALSWRTPAHDAVVIACSGPDWRIYVPMRTVPAVGLSGATVIQPPMQRAEAVIKRGDPVVIEAGTEGFAISREGVAMGDAAPGARFMVKVDDARTPVQAIARASGRATLPGWGE
ncbi:MULTISPECIES: flagella basal body P-ring formation protein FlgA [unclassified Sphingomonas]|uniref:flagella basal body P-ring formation protein FlgA n=1 Tax=unclassified Sphingomonas TaxID=196159 RepID=UPI001F5A63AA|nr:MULTISPECIES: flagella basal body P-ring formation protein FlgA [unclassified Sphingomonas]